MPGFAPSAICLHCRRAFQADSSRISSTAARDFSFFSVEWLDHCCFSPLSFPPNSLPFVRLTGGGGAGGSGGGGGAGRMKFLESSLKSRGIVMKGGLLGCDP